MRGCRYQVWCVDFESFPVVSYRIHLVPIELRGATSAIEMEHNEKAESRTTLLIDECRFVACECAILLVRYTSLYYPLVTYTLLPPFSLLRFKI